MSGRWRTRHPSEQTFPEWPLGDIVIPTSEEIEATDWEAAEQRLADAAVRWTA